MGIRTKQIHAGVVPDPATGAILTPIHQSTTFVQESVDDYMEKGYSYSRAGNPTVRALELKLAALEGGLDATAYASGMAATVSVFLALLQSGDHILVADVVYGGTYRFADQFLTKFGVEVDFVDAADATSSGASGDSNAILRGLVESGYPGRVLLPIVDAPAVEAARQAGIGVHGLLSAPVTRALSPNLAELDPRG